MQMTGARILMECLLEQGVDTIFGYPGGTILNVYDELYNYEGKVRHILTAHEQGACHAADGYARSTGKVGVCFATSGPGATNLVTGIATAYMDSSPIVCITCNVGLSFIGKDSFQEVDITGVTMPIMPVVSLLRPRKPPAPITVMATGASIRLAKASNSLCARLRTTPPPQMSSGFFELLIISTSLSMSS